MVVLSAFPPMVDGHTTAWYPAGSINIAWLQLTTKTMLAVLNQQRTFEPVQCTLLQLQLFNAVLSKLPNLQQQQQHHGHP
jgi:hypothetical protein